MTIKKSNEFDKDAEIIYFPGDVNDLVENIPNEFVQLVITSPPYNLGKEYEDKLNLDIYLNQQEKIIKECVRILKPTGSICWQVGNFVENGEIIPLDILLFPIFSKLGLHLRNRIIWHFGHGLHAKNRFSGRYEVILWFTKTDDYVFNLDPVRVPQKYPKKRHYKGPKKGQLSGNPLGKNPSDIWNIPNVKANHVEKTSHPCQFPVELIERLVLSLSNEGDWVFDPFMGVGSTAIASLLHNRKSIGAEIMNDYVKIGWNRIKKAERGELKIRPMERPIYDPNNPESYVPPQKININSTIEISQQRLFEKREKYESDEEDE
ncbi:MAG TPA: site-specific DNA-methyltransferase [Anaerolineaceae bacterium]|jgi:adenine-specific DNA-methyltransferase|nr:MAG: BstYI methyltransferase [Anaerolineaceae bacterium 46_22]HAF48883.1 site-specific DNA-methyltransferase [Anaerolineaceae bacterium]